MVIHNIAGGEGPSGEFLGLEGVHAHMVDEPVFPLADACLCIYRGHGVCKFAIDLFLQSGNLHFNVESQLLECVVLPRKVTSVLGRNNIGGSLECEFKVGLGVEYGEVGEQCHCTALGDDIVG